MKRVRFLHTADLHLDTPFKGLLNLNEDLRKRLCEALHATFSEMIQLAIEREVDFILIAGDLFEQQQRGLSAQFELNRGFRRLNEEGIRVFISCGNHDPVTAWSGGITLPENVHLFSSKKVEAIPFPDASDTRAIIYGRSFRTAHEERNLASGFPVHEGESVGVAVLHGTVGSSGSHAPYAPFKIGDVLNKGYDYWALGHIHNSRIERERDPAVVYPGIPQGRDFGECGVKGVYLVEVGHEEEPGLEFLPLARIVFEEVTLDYDQGETFEDFLRRPEEYLPVLKEGKSVVVRLKLQGRTAETGLYRDEQAFQQELDDFNAIQLSQDTFIWISEIDNRLKPELDLSKIEAGEDFIAALFKKIRALEQDKDSLLSWLEDQKADKIHALLRKEELGPGLEDLEVLLQRTRRTLIQHFLEK